MRSRLHQIAFACSLAVLLCAYPLAAAAYDLHYDYTSFETGFGQSQFNVLNYPSMGGNYMMTSTDNHRPEMVANNNALAEFKYQYEYDWKGAEAEFKTAIDLNPNVAWIHQAYGWFLMSDGRFDEATAEMERARQLDPSSMSLEAARGRLFYFSRQYDRAIQHYQEMLSREPDDSSIQYALYWVYIRKGMYAEALDMFLKNQRAGGMPEKVERELRDAFASGGWVGYQRKVLAEMERPDKEGNVAPERLAETRPDVIVILPWNLRNEIAAQLAYAREGWGARLVVPIPRVEVIER